MQIKITYKGTLDGKYCISCGHIKEGMIVEEEINVYYPDEGKVFVKNDEKYTAVILKENETIEDYQEIAIEEENKDDIITR